MNLPLAFELPLNPVQVLIIGAIAVLLFGKRLPEVGRSLGKQLAEFRKGIHGIEEAIQKAGTSLELSETDLTESSYGQHVDDHDEATAPKFEPPPQPRKEESAEVRGN